MSYEESLRSHRDDDKEKHNLSPRLSVDQIFSFEDYLESQQHDN
jgi:hypothetical protein